MNIPCYLTAAIVLLCPLAEAQQLRGGLWSHEMLSGRSAIPERGVTREIIEMARQQGMRLDSSGEMTHMCWTAHDIGDGDTEALKEMGKDSKIEYLNVTETSYEDITTTKHVRIHTRWRWISDDCQELLAWEPPAAKQRAERDREQAVAERDRAQRAAAERASAQDSTAFAAKVAAEPPVQVVDQRHQVGTGAPSGSPAPSPSTSGRRGSVHQRDGPRGSTASGEQVAEVQGPSSGEGQRAGMRSATPAAKPRAPVNPSVNMGTGEPLLNGSGTRATKSLPAPAGKEIAGALAKVQKTRNDRDPAQACVPSRDDMQAYWGYCFAANPATRRAVISGIESVCEFPSDFSKPGYWQWQQTWMPDSQGHRISDFWSSHSSLNIAKRTKRFMNYLDAIHATDAIAVMKDGGGANCDWFDSRAKAEQSRVAVYNRIKHESESVLEIAGGLPSLPLPVTPYGWEHTQPGEYFYACYLELYGGDGKEKRVLRTPAQKIIRPGPDLGEDGRIPIEMMHGLNQEWKAMAVSLQQQHNAEGSGRCEVDQRKEVLEWWIEKQRWQEHVDRRLPRRSQFIEWSGTGTAPAEQAAPAKLPAIVIRDTTEEHRQDREARERTRREIAREEQEAKEFKKKQGAALKTQADRNRAEIERIRAAADADWKRRVAACAARGVSAERCSRPGVKQ